VLNLGLCEQMPDEKSKMEFPNATRPYCTSDGGQGINDGNYSINPLKAFDFRQTYMVE
jgi:hypothetical protein